ncbi:MAG: UDP-glucose 4-epimerase GalE [Ignavibacteria bacterium]|nr:UDP-glucose 4-epimerase GalE [Ignavibacteria bacterium]
MSILITGGAGYIGSHTVKELLRDDKEVVVFDNLSRGHIEAIPDNVKFEKLNILDSDLLLRQIIKYRVDSIIHFAAFAYVEESVKNPLLYYRNNVNGSFSLIQAAITAGVSKFIFSSTCSVYGNPEKIPIDENAQVNPINPYAKTKLLVENKLIEVSKVTGMKYVLLRYFNAAGDSPDGDIGESHTPEPHLIPRIMYSALGKLDNLKIYGDDYPTKDGTCIRDYIHVTDLAVAHLKALEYLDDKGESTVINLGTGDGYSVKEIIDKARKVTGINIKAEVTARRPGDPATLVADNKKAKQILKWNPKFGLEDIIQTAWNWHKNQKY